MLTRREATLLLFAFTVFVVAYNSDGVARRFAHPPSSLALASTALAGYSASSLKGLHHVFRGDGRRVEQYADELETLIVGDWGEDSRQTYDLGPHGLTMDQQRTTWKYGDLPMTELIGHVPGYTILDNVLFLNGTLFLVSDQVSHGFPKPEEMISNGLPSPYPAVKQDLMFLTRYQALETIGYSAHRMPGVSVICFDQPAAPIDTVKSFGAFPIIDFRYKGRIYLFTLSGSPGLDNHTFLTLQRAYSALGAAIYPLPPPDRTIFANTKKIQLNSTGYDLKLARAALPYMGHIYAEDWDDLERAARPLFFDRVVLADRVSAVHGATAWDMDKDIRVHVPAPVGGEQIDDDAHRSAKAKRQRDVQLHTVGLQPTDRSLARAPAFAFPAPSSWFSQLRRNLLDVFALTDDPRARVVTYVSTQHRASGPRLRAGDHAQLVAELRALVREQGRTWALEVVELGDGVNGAPRVDRDSHARLAGEEAVSPWAAHVRAALRSSVMLGVWGDALALMPLVRKVSPAPTVVEFFPDRRFSNENEFVARALGVGYVAWRNTKKYEGSALPPISPPSEEDSEVISIDVKAVVQFVKEQLRR